MVADITTKQLIGSAILLAIILCVPIAAIWVFCDGRKRGMSRFDAIMWFFGVCLIPIVFLPSWFLWRPKLSEEDKTMTHKEIEQRLVEIVNMPNSGQIITKQGGGKIDSGQRERYKELRHLALEVGASHISTAPQKTANEGELVYAIHQALQTATMIDACKTAARNYKIALIATVIALGSALAAWIAVLSR